MGQYEYNYTAVKKYHGSFLLAIEVNEYIHNGLRNAVNLLPVGSILVVCRGKVSDKLSECLACMRFPWAKHGTTSLSLPRFTANKKSRWKRLQTGSKYHR